MQRLSLIVSYALVLAACNLPDKSLGDTGSAESEDAGSVTDASSMQTESETGAEACYCAAPQAPDCPADFDPETACERTGMDSWCCDADQTLWLVECLGNGDVASMDEIPCSPHEVGMDVDTTTPDDATAGTACQCPPPQAPDTPDCEQLEADEGKPCDPSATSMCCYTSSPQYGYFCQCDRGTCYWRDPRGSEPIPWCP